MKRSLAERWGWEARNLKNSSSISLPFQSYKVKMPTNIRDYLTPLFTNPSHSILSPVFADVEGEHEGALGKPHRPGVPEAPGTRHPDKSTILLLPDVRDLARQFCSTSLCHPLQTLTPSGFGFSHLWLREISVNQPVTHAPLPSVYLHWAQM